MNETFKADLFEPDVHFQIEEAKGEQVGGQAILGKIRGNFFVPDGVSRNNRFYPRDLWEKTLTNPNTVKRLQERRMLGTISHEQPLNDTALLEGKISHIVTDLRVEGNKGVGEAVILDTPAGRNLNVLLRAGSKLFVSSRANGSFEGEEKGVPRVNPETYILESFDFVIDPGFVQANPQLVEKLEKMIEEQSEKEHVAERFQNLLHEPKESPAQVPAINPTLKGDKLTMEKELFETILKEKNSAESRLEKTLGELQDKDREVTSLQLKLESVTKDLEEAKNEFTVSSEESNHLKEQIEKLQDQVKTLEAYEAFGTPEELEEAFDAAETRIKEYKEVGEPAEITEKLSKFEEELKAYHELGTTEEIEEAFSRSLQVVEAYKELGTPAEISEAFDRVDVVTENFRQKEAETRAGELAKELGVAEATVSTLIAKDMSDDEIREHVSGLKESLNVSSRYEKRGDSKEGKGSEKGGFMNESRGRNLINSLVRPAIAPKK